MLSKPIQERPFSGVLYTMNGELLTQSLVVEHSKLSQLLIKTGACAVRAGWLTLPRNVTCNSAKEESWEIRERVAHLFMCVGACVKDKREQVSRLIACSSRCAGWF